MTASFPQSPDQLPVRRALISVSNKTGLVEAGRRLAALGVELISTGGTRAALQAAGLRVRDVAELTGWPEMMDGRVKTLHPAVHGGLLGVRNAPTHAEAMERHGIGGIDLLWVDLYPFEHASATGAPYAEVVEQIDIGGPAMIRSAAKNHGYVAVCTALEQLEQVVQVLEAEGGTSIELRHELAAAAFARTAAYDAAISAWFMNRLRGEAPVRKVIAGRLGQTLRYGENPHQRAAFYRTHDGSFGVATARQVQGKALSYNNIVDTDAAFELVAEWEPWEPWAPAAVAIIKHANPCGVALGDTVEGAYRRALQCDPVSAFGGIVATNRTLDSAAAQAIVEVFTEVVIAPEADEEALAVFAGRKNLRLLLTGGFPAHDPQSFEEVFRSVSGGFLVQSRDNSTIGPEDLKVVTRRQPTAAEVADMLFAFTVAKHVKSNAIVYARNGQTLGVGAGQMNRKDSARIAALRAADFGLDLRGCACASEAFFPFADGLLEAAAAGATAVIQPGGSMRDAEVIAAADEAGIAMAFTGVRVFRH
ncbi:MAG: bifunctional phosphoribosylaminoimidazolecarboxamide formyltransferase/IMP cyclohydrolase [Proteobacteria bacterium]|nr:bifunctional phosphoribosylaminoimidazolecarboxamide formyltransferase/IMP cyclohydrolase [Pseudomonadota bacterium]